jgi:carboxyl-terminal processing protease
MNRERTAWLVSVVLVAILAFQIPGTLAHRDDDYAFIRTLLDIHRQVTTNYVESVDDQKLQQAAIEGMLGQLDPYTVYIPPANLEQFENMLEGNFKGVGIQLEQNAKGECEVVTPIEDSPAFKAGVQAGDIIIKVNGEDISNLRLPDVMKKIKGPLDSPVALTVRHADGKTADLTMTRQEIVMPSVKGYRRGGDNAWVYWVSDNPKIGYVRIIQFTNDTFEKLKGIMDVLLKQNLQGLVLDLRFDPGGRLDQAEEVVDLFVKQGIIVKVKGRNRPETVKMAKEEGTLPDFPMAVMVNEHSASASEIVAGSLKDNKRAIVVGTRSFGKGSVQEVVPLDDNEGELKITVAYYYLPSGRLVHRKKDSKDWGVDPQIDVPMDNNAEERLLRAEGEQDVLHGPIAHVSTNPSSVPATEPTTQPIDPQLDAAVTAVIQMVHNGGKIDLPESKPTTQPAPAAANE